MLAMTAGNDPDFDPVMDAIEDAEDRVSAALARATTPEEIDAIRKIRSEGWKMLNEAVKKGLAARAEAEKKERQH